jgi:gluconokinase
VRTLLFDGEARAVEGFGKQIAYDVTTTADGGVEVDPRALCRLAMECLAEIHAQLAKAGLRPAAVAAAGFWHSFLGIDRRGGAVTPIYHLLDTRSAPQARRLKELLDQRQTHARVGCVFHPSYWPSRLVWLAESRPDEFRAAARWVSFGDYLFRLLFGEPAESTSMVSGSGLWDQNRNAYEETLLAHLPIEARQLADPAAMDREQRGLRGDFALDWPLFQEIPWFPAIGDGAANNVGSGCITRDRFALMVGTTGAMRAVIEAPQTEIPWGAWCYRIDRRRFVMGGALSDGGKVFEWMLEHLAGLPEGAELERRLAAMTPGAHGLTVLPLFAGERSPNWNADARAAITGISLHTSPVDILRASLEAVAIRFRMIYDILRDRVGEPREVVATGGALLRSPAWTQMMADALERPIVACLENETSSRGAAMLALERLGVRKLAEFSTSLGETFSPGSGQAAAYADMLEKQKRLYGFLYPQ